MKRRLFILTSLVLAVLLVFAGCMTPAAETEKAEAESSGSVQNGKEPVVSEKEAEPLRVCVDLEWYSDDNGATQKVILENFLRNVELNALAKQDGGPTEIELEMIPVYEWGSEERSVAVGRLRAEIMAGAGPDVFFMGPNFGLSDVLFAMPEKTMQNGVFLPLDEYIENAQYMEWDKLQPQVMAAGRNEYGQQILPITYSIPLTIYRQTDVPALPDIDTTWQDMLEDETKILRTAAMVIDPYIYWEYGTCSEMFISCTLGDIGDFENDKILLTEEQLKTRMDELLMLSDEYLNGDQHAAVPPHFNAVLNKDFLRPNAGFQFSVDPRMGIEEDESVTMIPMYSDDGGVTALIQTYAAVNINTSQPEQAFYVLDYLLSLENQQNSDLYTMIGRDGIGPHMDLLSENAPVCWAAGGVEWSLPLQWFEAYCSARDQITRAVYYSRMEFDLRDLYANCDYARENGEAYDGYIQETYREFKQMMAE